jgi:hypothetical protein
LTKKKYADQIYLKTLWSSYQLTQIINFSSTMPIFFFTIEEFYQTNFVTIGDFYQKNLSKEICIIPFRWGQDGFDGYAIKQQIK